MNTEQAWEAEAARLAHEMQLGRAEAFDELYELMASRALRVASGILLSAQDAADAVQEAFLRLWTNIRRFRPSFPFAPWFYRILINECHRIRQKRKPAVPLDEIPEQPSSFHSFTQVDLKDALCQLPLRQRTALSLKYLSGLPEKDVARLMHASLPAVKCLLVRARQALGKELG